MRLIVAGSRTITNSKSTYDALDALPFKPTEIVVGGCKGPDMFGELWAKNHGIPVKGFPADWDNLGRGAGPVRNQQMADYAAEDVLGGALIAFWQRRSPGTCDMIDRARAKGLWVRVVEVGPEPLVKPPGPRPKGIFSAARED